MAPRYTVSSRDASLQWPRVPSGDAATVLVLHAQNERSQWLAPDALRQAQMVQLRAMLRHSVATVPYYREAFTGLLDPDTPFADEVWRALPILDRKILQEQSTALASEAPPASHGAVRTMQSSGSTGTPVQFQTSRITSYFYYANNLRHYRWHDYDSASRYAGIIRLTAAQRELADAEKPVPWMMGYVTGPYFYFDVARPADEQIAWLKSIQPQYLTTYPSNLRNLLSECRKEDLPFLRAVTVMAEALDDDLRDECRQVLGIPLHDIYSAQEAGIVALQCPSGDGYHVMSETVLVEILDDAGRPCAPGEIGRVVVTPLQNFVMPLIRYEIGDYAEAGAVCPCGRGLPSVKRILGRVRNMLVLPDGRKIWPSFGSRGLTAIAPIRQHQVVQKSVSALEVRLVVERPLTAEEEDAIAKHVTARLPVPMSVVFAYPDRIWRAEDGKFEDFVSEVVGA